MWILIATAGEFPLDHKNHSKHNNHSQHETHAAHSMHESHDKHKDHAKHQGDHGMGHSSHHEMMIQDFTQRFFVSVILSIPVLILSPSVQELLGYTLSFPLAEPIQLILSTIIYVYGGIPFFKGFIDEMRKSLPGMMTLVTLAISTAYFYSASVILFIPGKPFFWELVTLIDVMLFGHWIEMKSVLGASKALENLVKLLPSEAHLVDKNGSTKDVPISELKPEDVILIRPGEKVPVDGQIIKGQTSVNESFLTGESLPVSKKEGEIVIAGSVNGDGSITVKVLKTGKDTYLSQVIEMVNEAQKARSKTQDLANRAAFILTLVAIVGGISTFVTWISLGESLNFALERMVTVIVIACPHALGLAVPLVVAISTSISANNGLLIRDRVAFERARMLNAVVFDKTGTLTKGEFGVTDIVILTDISEERLVQIAASLEVNSEHPIGKGIVKAATERNVKLFETDDFQALPGEGITAKIGNDVIYVVSPAFIAQKEMKFDHDKVSKLQQQGKTVVFVVMNGQVQGAIALADQIREESRVAIEELHKMGIKTYMLTGDNRKVASWVSEELGIDKFYAEVLPHEKSDVIKKIQAEGNIVAMAGDGVNDAPALVQADLGIAIGAGTDVAIESADVVLVRNDPRDIVSIVKLARKTYRKMQENLLWATGYNLIALPLAAGVLYTAGIVLSPAVGGLLMSLSTVIVAFNARRLGL